MALTHFEQRQQWAKYGKPEPPPKKVYRIPKKSAKKIKQEKEEKERRCGHGTELQKWYDTIMQKEEGKCWETGQWIDKYQDIIEDGEVVGVEFAMGWRGSIAHILPKSLFPSVATNPLNYMILKMWGGTHGQYDSSWQNASQMKVWPYAIKIINILYPLLTPDEKKKLPDEIVQVIKPEIYNK